MAERRRDWSVITQAALAPGDRMQHYDESASEMARRLG